MLNRIWTFFFIGGFVAAIGRTLAGHSEVWRGMVAACFDSAKTGFEIALGLTGIMCLWLGIMRIGERGGAVDFLARAFGPLGRRLFPGIPEGHPAHGSIVMNITANMLGLDNAATPLGLKAMGQLQELNPSRDTASDDQILFMVINAASVTIVPTTILTFRAQLGAADPTDVFLPILVATFAATMAGLIATSFRQRLRLWDPVVLAYLGGMTAVVAGLVAYFAHLDQATLDKQSSLLANVLIFGMILAFLGAGLRKRVDLFGSFVDGGKEGFHTAIGIVPYLVAMLVGIGVFRASGALDLILGGVRHVVAAAGIDTRWVDALPTALMKPLSGSGARGMMIETMRTHGADSFAGRLACTIQGSTETTFYVLAVYFGSVNIRRTRHAVACALTADIVGYTTAILMAYLFWGQGGH